MPGVRTLFRENKYLSIKSNTYTYNDLRALAELKKEGKSAEDIGVQLRGEFASKYPGWAQPQRVQAAAVIYRELE